MRNNRDYSDLILPNRETMEKLHGFYKDLLASDAKTQARVDRWAYLMVACGTLIVVAWGIANV